MEKPMGHWLAHSKYYRAFAITIWTLLKMLVRNALCLFAFPNLLLHISCTVYYEKHKRIKRSFAQKVYHLLGNFITLLSKEMINFFIKQSLDNKTES